MKKKNKDFYLNWVAENFNLTSDDANQIPEAILELDIDDDELIFSMVHLAYILQQRKGNQIKIPLKELEEAMSIGHQRFIVHLGFFELIKKGFLLLEKPIHLFTFDLETDFVIKHFEPYPKGVALDLEKRFLFE